MLGDRVDTLVSLDIRGRGAMHLMYPPARKLKNGRPLSLLAAERLKEEVNEGDFVLITTGLSVPVYLMPETDGPPGAAAIGRALNVGLRAKPVFVIKNEFVEMMAATCRAAELNVLSLDHLKDSKVRKGCAVTDFPIDDVAAKEKAGEILDTLKPKAIISVESRDFNEKGIIHSLMGYDWSKYEAKVPYIFQEASKRKILTIGFFDGCCMEIGTSVIKDIVKNLPEDFPYAAKCQCPCGAGTTAATEVEIGIPSAICNWGPYGIAACLSAMLDNPSVLHDPDLEVKIIARCVEKGALEGTTNEATLVVDEIPAETHASFIRLLRQAVVGARRGTLMGRFEASGR